MSFNPSTILTIPYIGAPFPQDHKLCNPLPPGELPQLVPLSLIWSSYGVSQANPNAAASIDLSSFGLKKFSAVRGCYIDNTGSDGSIFVYFPDTGFAVTCAPYSTAWSPVLTNGVACTVAGKGFATNDASTTRVYLLNVPVNPDESAEVNYVYPLWRASPSISRGINQYSAGFASPAIGDQWQEFKLIGINGTVSQALFGSPYTQGGTITVTDLDISYGGSAAGAAALSTFKIQSNGASGILTEKNFGAAGFTDGGFGGPVVGPISGLQYKLNAAETWTASLATTLAYNNNGKLYCRIGYSYQGTSSATAPVTGQLGTLGQASGGQRVISAGIPYGGIRITSNVNAVVTSAQAQINDNSIPGNYHAELWTDNAGSPGVLLATSVTGSTIGTPNGTQQQFNFSTPPSIANGQLFWLLMVRENGSVQWSTYTLVDTFISGRAATAPAIVAGANMLTINDKFIMGVNYTLS